MYPYGWNQQGQQQAGQTGQQQTSQWAAYQQPQQGYQAQGQTQQQLPYGQQQVQQGSIGMNQLNPAFQQYQMQQQQGFMTQNQAYQYPYQAQAVQPPLPPGPPPPDTTGSNRPLNQHLMTGNSSYIGQPPLPPASQQQPPPPPVPNPQQGYGMPIRSQYPQQQQQMPQNQGQASVPNLNQISNFLSSMKNLDNIPGLEFLKNMNTGGVNPNPQVSTTQIQNAPPRGGMNQGGGGGGGGIQSLMSLEIQKPGPGASHQATPSSNSNNSTLVPNPLNPSHNKFKKSNGGPKINSNNDKEPEVFDRKTLQNFDKKFQDWEKEFSNWKKANQDHPDRNSYEKYLADWNKLREQLIHQRKFIVERIEHNEKLEAIKAKEELNSQIIQAKKEATPAVEKKESTEVKTDVPNPINKASPEKLKEVKSPVKEKPLGSIEQLNKEKKEDAKIEDSKKETEPKVSTGPNKTAPDPEGIMSQEESQKPPVIENKDGPIPRGNDPFEIALKNSLRSDEISKLVPQIKIPKIEDRESSPPILRQGYMEDDIPQNPNPIQQNFNFNQNQGMRYQNPGGPSQGGQFGMQSQNYNSSSQNPFNSHQQPQQNSNFGGNYSSNQNPFASNSNPNPFENQNKFTGNFQQNTFGNQQQNFNSQNNMQQQNFNQNNQISSSSFAYPNTNPIVAQSQPVDPLAQFRRRPTASGNSPSVLSTRTSTPLSGSGSSINYGHGGGGGGGASGGGENEFDYDDVIHERFQNEPTEEEEEEAEGVPVGLDDEEDEVIDYGHGGNAPLPVAPKPKVLPRRALKPFAYGFGRAPPPPTHYPPQYYEEAEEEYEEGYDEYEAYPPHYPGPYPYPGHPPFYPPHMMRGYPPMPRYPGGPRPRFPGYSRQPMAEALALARGGMRMTPPAPIPKFRAAPSRSPPPPEEVGERGEDISPGPFNVDDENIPKKRELRIAPPIDPPIPGLMSTRIAPPIDEDFRTVAPRSSSSSRRSREKSRDRERERDRDRERERSRDRDKTNETYVRRGGRSLSPTPKRKRSEREDSPILRRDRERERDRDREIRDKEREKERERDRDRNKERDRGRDRDRDRERDREKERERDRDRGRDRHKDRHHRSKSKSPDRLKVGRNPAPPPAPSAHPAPANPQRRVHSTHIDDLINLPGRKKRPHQIVIILRGLPGSGKTQAAKLIKDKEIEHGGSAPRMLSIDDYFMTEQIKTIKDPITGKEYTDKVMVYEYEAEAESSYRLDLIRALKKSIDTGYFNFIIVDCVNERMADVDEMANYASLKKFYVFIAELEGTVDECFERNAHQRTREDIQRLHDQWEKTPDYYVKLNIKSLFEEPVSLDVEMEDVSDIENKNKTVSPEVIDLDEDDDEVLVCPKSKWEQMDHSEERLNKLDGFKRKKKDIQDDDSTPQSMEEWLKLQMSDIYTNAPPEGKKRVRWADIAERQNQERMRDVGFIVGQTNWDRMNDPTIGEAALTKTRFI